MFLRDRPIDQIHKYHNILTHIQHYNIQYRDFHIALLGGWPVCTADSSDDVHIKVP